MCNIKKKSFFLNANESIVTNACFETFFCNFIEKVTKYDNVVSSYRKKTHRTQKDIWSTPITFSKYLFCRLAARIDYPGGKKVSLYIRIPFFHQFFYW